MTVVTLCGPDTDVSPLPCRSLGAKIALHLGAYHSSSFGKLVSDAGSAGGPNSSTAVLDAVDVGMPVVQRLTKLKTLLERPSNAATVCQWVLVRYARAFTADFILVEHVQSVIESVCAGTTCLALGISNSLLAEHCWVSQK